MWGSMLCHRADHTPYDCANDEWSRKPTIRCGGSSANERTRAGSWSFPENGSRRGGHTAPTELRKQARPKHGS